MSSSLIWRCCVVMGSVGVSSNIPPGPTAHLNVIRTHEALGLCIAGHWAYAGFEARRGRIESMVPAEPPAAGKVQLLKGQHCSELRQNPCNRAWNVAHIAIGSLSPTVFYSCASECIRVHLCGLVSGIHRDWTPEHNLYTDIDTTVMCCSERVKCTETCRTMSGQLLGGASVVMYINNCVSRSSRVLSCVPGCKCAAVYADAKQGVRQRTLSFVTTAASKTHKSLSVTVNAKVT